MGAYSFNSLTVAYFGPMGNCICCDCCISYFAPIGVGVLECWSVGVKVGIIIRVLVKKIEREHLVPDNMILGLAQAKKPCV